MGIVELNNAENVVKLPDGANNRIHADVYHFAKISISSHVEGLELSKLSINNSAINKVFDNVGYHSEKNRFYYISSNKLASQAERDFDVILKELGVQIWNPTNEEKETIRSIASKQSVIDGDKFNKLISKIRAGITNSVMKALKQSRYQFSSISYRVDMFSDESRLEFDDKQNMTVILPHREFKVGNYQQKYIDDYKNYFIEIDDFINFIAACRFASDRKTGFLWLQAESGWGKEFLTSALSNLGIIVSFDISELIQIIKGSSPCGRTPLEMASSWVMLINELKGITTDIRKIESKITINTKFQLSSTVPVYSKVFTSKDPITGLTGDNGVESQFVNRFNHFKLLNKSIDRDSKLFSHKVKAEYLESITYWLGEKLNEIVSTYRELGRKKATEKADVYLNQFHEKYTIEKTQGCLDDHFTDIRDDFYRKCIEEYNQNSCNNPNFKYGSFVVKCEKTDRHVLTKPSKAFEMYCRENYQESEAKDIIRARSEIMPEARRDKQTPYYKNGQRINCKGVYLD